MRDGTLTAAKGVVPFVGMSNVLSEEKRQQEIALGAWARPYDASSNGFGAGLSVVAAKNHPATASAEDVKSLLAGVMTWLHSGRLEPKIGSIMAHLGTYCLPSLEGIRGPEPAKVRRDRGSRKLPVARY